MQRSLLYCNDIVHEFTASYLCVSSVQTPLKDTLGLCPNHIQIGDPVFFRPAKAGEVAERFSEYILIGETDTATGKNEDAKGTEKHGRRLVIACIAILFAKCDVLGTVITLAKTYRGLAQVFY